MVNLSSYAKLDPAYFSEGVQALTAINLVLSFVKLLATYGRKLFALMDAAKSILKTYTGHEAASEGDDGTVQVCETMTDLAAIAILGLLNKQDVKNRYKRQHRGEEVSFAKLVLQEELDFDVCNLGDGDLPGLVALVTHAEMAVKLRSLSLGRNTLVTAQAWEKALTDMSTKGSSFLSSLNLQHNDIRIKGGAAIAEALRVNGSLTSLDVSSCDIGNEATIELVSIFKEKHMTSIGLADCGLDADAAEVIAEYVRVSGSLTSLDVCSNKITGDGAQQLSAAVLGKQTLEIFSQIPLKELRADKLTTLDLTSSWGKDIGVPGALVLAELLRTVSGSLTSLDVGCNKIGKEAALKLVSIFKERQMTSVGLGGCDLGPDGGKVVADYIRDSGSLTNLKLSINNLAGETDFIKAAEVQGSSFNVGDQ
eukprot:scaffold126109_cov27-Phaeocystis_antarctica.AAC.1